MKSFTKFLLLVMTIVFSSSLIIAQVNPAISVSNPENQKTQQTQDLSLQKELDLKALHPGKNVYNPPGIEGDVRANGDNCSDPFVVTFPGMLPYSHTTTTQGRVDDYNTTILGSYDNGPDAIYQVNVTSTTELQFTVTPVGSYQYAGMALFSSCPPGPSNHIVYTSSSNGAITFTQTLFSGTYYLMVDNWAPGPDYINYTLTVVVPPPPAPGAACTTAFSYGNVNGPSMNGTLAAGTSVWYSFTAPSNMLTSVSLCATTPSMDTKLDIYTACGSAVLFTNDDNCGLLSRIDNINLPGGQTYYARVYGYSSSVSGPFNLAITGVAPPANDD